MRKAWAKRSSIIPHTGADRQNQNISYGGREKSLPFLSFIKKTDKNNHLQISFILQSYYLLWEILTKHPDSAIIWIRDSFMPVKYRKKTKGQRENDRKK